MPNPCSQCGVYKGHTANCPTQRQQPGGQQKNKQNPVRRENDGRKR